MTKSVRHDNSNSRNIGLDDMLEADLSIVIITPDRCETIRKTLRHLRGQTLRNRLEIVIVAPSADKLALDDSDLKDFVQVRVVEVGAIESTAAARAAGTRLASAPLVAFVEDHSYPEPDWAEALIGVHRQPWAAVGPVIGNANPTSILSWANLLIEYAPWLEPAPAGMIDHLPGHNSAYKRTVLLDYGPELEAMLEAETVLHWDLRARGYRLYLEPKAKTHHVNFSLLLPCLPLRFHCGRLFAAARARNGRWSPLRRVLYAGGAPLIPVVRLWRILRELRRPGRRHDLLPRVLPALLLGLVLNGTGQMVGYAFGAGNAMRKLCDLEFHRHRYLMEQDKRVVVER